MNSDFNANTKACECCYSCISNHAAVGCGKCALFLETYIPVRNQHAYSKSIRKGLKFALTELFEALNITSIEIETRLTLTVQNFTDDFIKVYDEIAGPVDIQSMWHVPQELAMDIYAVCIDFLNSELDEVEGNRDDNQKEDWDSDDGESSAKTISSESDSISSD